MIRPVLVHLVRIPLAVKKISSGIYIDSTFKQLDFEKEREGVSIQ